MGTGSGGSLKNNKRTSGGVSPSLKLGSSEMSTNNNLVMEADGLSFTKPARAKSDAMVLIDINKVENAFKDLKNAHIGAGGTENAIGNRYAKFQQWLKKNPNTPIETPEMNIPDNGEPISFTNGRHRFSVLRDMGKDKMWASVPADKAEEFEKRFGATDLESRKQQSLAHAEKALADSNKPPDEQHSDYLKRLFEQNLLEKERAQQEKEEHVTEEGQKKEGSEKKRRDYLANMESPAELTKKVEASMLQDMEDTKVKGEPASTVVKSGEYGYDLLLDFQDEALDKIDAAREEAGMGKVHVPPETQAMFDGQPITERLYHMISQNMSDKERTESLKMALGRAKLQEGSSMDALTAADMAVQSFGSESQDANEIKNQYTKTLGNFMYEQFLDDFNQNLAASDQVLESLQSDRDGIKNSKELSSKEKKASLKKIDDHINLHKAYFEAVNNVARNLSDDEKVALYAYTTMAYQHGNGLMKTLANMANGALAPEPDASIAPGVLKDVYSNDAAKDVAVLMQLVMDSMGKMPKEETVVDRVMYLRDTAAFDPGNDFYYPGASSTNAVDDYGEAISAREEDLILGENRKHRTKVSFLAAINNGVRIGHLGVNSNSDFDAEIITPPGTIYHIDGGTDVANPPETSRGEPGAKRWRKVWGRQRTKDGLVDVKAQPRKQRKESEELSEQEKTERQNPKNMEQKIRKGMSPEMVDGATF